MFTTVNSEIEQMKQMVRNFVENEVEPYAQQIEEEDAIPNHLIEQAKELGLFGMSIPEEYGGIGLGMIGKAAVLEQLGRTHNGFVTLISAHTGIGSTGLVRLASPFLKDKYLPILLQEKGLPHLRFQNQVQDQMRPIYLREQKNMEING